MLSPFFPPGDTVDMHRVRMTVAHYKDHGWQPTILCVRATDSGRHCDQGLKATLSDGLDIVEVTIPDNFFYRLLGITAIGIRAKAALKRAGNELLQKGDIDLVFISTTAFPLMSLGRIWKHRFAIPFVLDFQDPWASFPPSAKEFARPGLRHGLMRSVHRFLEARTVPMASGLMAVSKNYLELLAEKYRQVKNIPHRVSPFPYSENDFKVAGKLGQPNKLLERSGNEVICLYAGRIAPGMEESLRSVFKTVAEGNRQMPSVFGRMRFVFIGTGGYSHSGNVSVAARLASEAGVSGQVCEYPDRIAFLDAQKCMLDADALLILGSQDKAYMPSKLHQSLSLDKPIICAAPAGAAMTELLSGLDGVVFIDADEKTKRDFPVKWSACLDLLEKQATFLGENRSACSKIHEASVSAKADCAFFDQVLQQHEMVRNP